MEKDVDKALDISYSDEPKSMSDFIANEKPETPLADKFKEQISKIFCNRRITK